MNSEDPRRASALDHVLAVVRRRKGLGLLVFAGLATCLGAGLLALPDLYRSTATVLIESRQFPEGLMRSTVTSAVETRLKWISEEIMSRARLARLIASFDLYPDLRRRGSELRVLERMRRDIQLDLKGVERRIKGDTTTIAFTLSYVGHDPDVTANVTNTLVSSYIDENQKMRERQTRETAEFLRAQLAGATDRLRQEEQKVAEFKRRHIGALPEQIGANMTSLEQLHTQLRANQANQVRAAERRSARAEGLAESRQAAGTPARGTSRLTKLRQELAALRTQATDKHPDVIRLRHEIANLERLGPESEALRDDDPTAQLRRDAVADATAELRALKGEEARLLQAIALYQGRVERAPALEEELRAVSSGYDAAREQHKSLQARYAEAEMGENMEARRSDEQLRIIEAAVPVREPIAPNRLRLAAMGLIAALGLTGAAVVLAEMVDHSIHSSADVTDLGVPVAAAIPLIVTPADRRRRRRRRTLATAGAVTVLVALGVTSYLIAAGNQPLAAFLARA